MTAWIDENCGVDEWAMTPEMARRALPLRA
jgi:hypothetical protein